MPASFHGLSLIVRMGVIPGLIVLLAACGAEDDTAAVKQPGPPTCPATFVNNAPTKASRYGDLVPEGSSTALLCVYSFPRTGDQYPLRQPIPLAADKMDGLADYLNTLDPADLESNACTLAGHDQYQVILGYPDDTKVTVRVDYNCGIVSAVGAVRQVGQMKTLLGFWPERAVKTYRTPAQTPSSPQIHSGTAATGN
ncbi:hypothetical protein [Micromonospora sp. U21]|uniref:hypothetical protein n=1 Tax=Micromonospora sp. U21 TaxID=2824899 RepID=UPI001B36B76C|nr:hypothetical protein [Micromonospora sp. U21]MBQ0905564.1 hypothetical protein [Micromonospora sp. U21]